MTVHPPQTPQYGKAPMVGGVSGSVFNQAQLVAERVSRTAIRLIVVVLPVLDHDHICTTIQIICNYIHFLLLTYIYIYVVYYAHIYLLVYI